MANGWRAWCLDITERDCPFPHHRQIVRTSMPRTLNHWTAAPPAYDRWQFDTRYRRFSAQRKISHEDYGRMGTERHSVMQSRPGGYPEWLADDAQIRAVLSHALIGGPAGSLEDLCTRAHARFQKYMHDYWMTPEGCSRYSAVRHCGNIVRLYAKLVFYYKLGYDSRQIAEECGMSRVAVRQRLMKLNQVASKLFPQSV
jgi:hypothetical protein